ncbi:type IV pilus modification PilV family protein [Sporichthya polymorpha]|uniref:type IV pilus modification PilV family protein n=1 Tax=Sporichthya polymorpha TaxID=35751 RepID=UPI0003AA6FA2|nr:type II secretion system protein [Sporichthya polymorpha]
MTELRRVGRWQRLRRRFALRRSDAGFSLFEVVVAITLLGITMAAVGPQMMASIRASGNAKLASQAKGLLQGHLDAMRTLPFRVTPTAGDHRDLLDTYFRNVSAPTTAPSCGTGTPNPPQASWSGYVSASSTARCSYEPAGVPMYRKVFAPGTGDMPPSFAIVLNTSFVSPGTTPLVLTPPAGFDSQVAGKDRPPSSQVGVTATVLYRDHDRWKPVTVYTQIASRTPSETRLKLDAQGTAIEVGSARSNGENITLTGGMLDLSGSLSTTSSARANLTAMTASSSLTGRQSGAALSVSAPYTNIANLNASVGSLGSGCSDPCWTATAITPFVLAADNGLPRAGVNGLAGFLNPVQTVSVDGFSFRAEAPTLPGLEPDRPLVYVNALPTVGSLLPDVLGSLYNCAFSVTAPLSRITGSGYINSTDEQAPSNPLSAEACGGAHASVVRVLPTAQAPDGLIRITARSAARCRVTGVAHTASTEVSYRADVEYWKWTPVLDLFGKPLLGLGVGQYVHAGTITPNTTEDPLAAIPLSTPVSNDHELGDYIESLTGLTKDRVTNVAANHVAEVTIPALVNVQTQPVGGASAPSTAVSMAVGASSCRAEDNR